MNITENIIINNFHIKINMLNDISMNLNAAEKSLKKVNTIQNEDFTSAAENLVQDVNMNSDDKINIF